MVMKVTSIRSGFATNSSSVHSIVLGGNVHSEWSKEKVAEHYDPSHGVSEFGWESTDYSGLDTLINYFMFGYGVDEVISRNVNPGPEFKSILDKAKEYSDQSNYGCFVDHGSEHLSGAGYSPLETDFWDFIYHTSYIEGGNDNDY